MQRRDEPTRDVYVTRDARGDREFAGANGNKFRSSFLWREEQWGPEASTAHIFLTLSGFGQPTGSYSDCFLDPALIPYEDIKVWVVRFLYGP